MLRFGKKLLAIILSVMIVISAFCTSVSVSALEVPEIEATGGDGSFGQYSTDELETALLIPHTGKSSELEGCAALDVVNEAQDDYEANFQTLSCDAGLYNDLGFNADALSAQAAVYGTDPDYQNPMSGYTFVNPNELLVCDTDRSDHYEAYINTYNDVKIGNASELNDDITALDRETESVNWHDDSDDWDIQTGNGMGIDVDGDGLDELAYFSLCYKEKDPDKGSSIRMKLFDRVADGDKFKWSLVDEYTTYMQSGDYVRDIPVGESRGYVPLAVGDYDDDGLEEIAYYMPDKKNDGDADDARVVIMKFTKDGSGSFSHSKLADFHIKDFTSDYSHMGEDWYLPTVALSTTSTRLGEDKHASTGATQYETHDDLVITVSVPRHYKNKDLDINSITKIFGYENGGFVEMFRYEYVPFDDNTKRMNYVNSCDADLNGDGFKELVVAGLKEKDMTKPDGAKDDNRRYGSFDQSHNYVNIITHNGTEYKMVWDVPKEVDAPGNLGIKHYSAIEPTAMCGGHYLHNSLGTKDQLCIQGVILDCQNAKVTGTPVYSENKKDGSTTYYITDTQPGHDLENFGSDVTFSKEYCYDLSEHVCADSDPDDSTMWLSTCTSGHFFNESDVDQIAIVSSDPVDANDDNVYMDISIISDTNSTDEDHWSYKAYNDYFSKRNEDDYGTTLFVYFMDTEEDTYYYRWAGSYASYSAPVLYSVIQVPPYYKEANSIYSTEFTITTGVSNNSGLNLGAGFSGGIENKSQVKLPLISPTADFGAQMGLDFTYSHGWSHEKEVSKTIYVESEEDCAVCYVVPIIINTYEILNTTDPNAEPIQFVEFSEPLEPVFTTLTVDQYNTALRTSLDGYTDNSENLSPDISAKMIDKEKLGKSCAGDPIMYDHTLYDATGLEEIDDKKNTDAGMVDIDVFNSGNDEMKGAELTFADVDDNSGSTTFGISVYAKFGMKEGFLIFSNETDLTFTLSGQIGATYGRTNSDGVSFATVFFMPDRQLLDGVSFSANDTGYNGINSQIQHYDPVNGHLYDYRATAVCYKQEDFEIPSDEAPGDDNVNMDIDDYIFAFSFYTTNYADPLPPEPPENFAIQSMKKNNDGSADITLLWNSKNRNPQRVTEGYNIYMSDVNLNSSAVHLQNREGVIKPSENSDYTLYTVHLDKDDYNDSSVFYIAPAYARLNSGGTLIVTEGTLCDKVSIASIDENTNGNLKIVKQPKTYWMAEDNSNETAQFNISVKKNVDSDSAVDFCWQLFDEDTDTWRTVKTETAVQPNGSIDYEDIYRSKCSIDIAGSNKNSYVDKGVRCIVISGNYSVTSDIVTMRYAGDKPVDSYLLGDADGDDEVTVIDVTLIQRNLASFAVPETFNDKAADVDGDDKVTILDATFIQRYLADMSVPYQIGETISA